MTDPTRGTPYRSLDDVICFDRIPLTNETADRLALGSQANSRSTDSANETTATAHCEAPGVYDASHSGERLTGIFRRGCIKAVSLLPILCGASWLLFIAESPGLVDQHKATGMLPAVVGVGWATHLSLDEYVLAIYPPVSHGHASESERPPSTDFEKSQPIMTNEQLVGVPELRVPALTIDSAASSLFEPASTLPQATLPFAPMTKSASSSEGDLLRLQERPGSNHRQTPNLRAPPEAGNFAPEGVTERPGTSDSL